VGLLTRGDNFHGWGIRLSGRDIFISYSREDRPAARHFSKCFAEEGFSVWWDATLQAGETFDEVIERELKAAKAVVVLWSPRSVQSRWVRAEATLADRSGKLVPAIIEKCDRPIIFELTHAAELADWTGDTSDSRWRGFVDDLRSLIEKHGAKAEPSRAAAPQQSARPAASPARPSASAMNGYGSRPAASRPSYGHERGIVGRREPPSAPAYEANELEDTDTTQFYRSGDFEAFKDEFHCLELTVGDKVEKRFIINPLGVKIGRTAPADIIISDPRVSRLHCKVELAGDQLRVFDLNSTNGTYIDSKRVHDAALLDIGSVLQVGNVSLKHEVRSSAKA
jgi:TIR domain/FHA domain